MTTKNIKTRIQNKHDIEANWQKATFAPLAGEIIIYDADETHESPRVKIGDGTTPIGDLPFIGMAGEELEELIAAANTYTDTKVASLISYGATDPDDAVTSQFYFKYSTD